MPRFDAPVDAVARLLREGDRLAGFAAPLLVLLTALVRAEDVDLEIVERERGVVEVRPPLAVVAIDARDVGDRMVPQERAAGGVLLVGERVGILQGRFVDLGAARDEQRPGVAHLALGQFGSVYEDEVLHALLA